MLEKYTTEREIGPSICDADGRLSYAESFGLFMDIASIHAGQLGNGVLDMAGMGLFWLTVKTQINFINRPQITQMVTMETWENSVSMKFSFLIQTFCSSRRAKISSFWRRIVSMRWI